ncbi:MULTISPECIES: GntR family transcriptional regulator [unclassified Variovorax]|jgi:GntR family transcriptional regulator|uniref:GntR family transcriptional regulator n=1 Tax=unclassified Variovorax TaxID=663243 RepID=UPI000F7F5867|nr:MULTISPECIES: GntR family transcriptional regulator [unclassified Variovorax]RSZ44239.1 GntR family transcriptional regulator [Variovorax sp. 553]RSZ45105.1 GntR family transcriptional regulator [Variovorax sp. 679]
MARPPASAPSLERGPGTSLHRQLFVVLRDEITRGVYSTGALPKEEALCERFGVSRITVRRALADLASLGLVERRHGLGTFVRADLPQVRARPSLGLVDGLRKAALETDVEVLEVAQSVAPPDVAALLQLEPDEKAVHALRLRSIDGVPVMLTEAWVPARLGKRVSASALRKHALYEILMAQGVKFGRVVQEITAEVADPARARLLQVETGAPLLKMVRLLHDLDAQPVQHLTVSLTAERSRILMDIVGETINTLTAGQVVHDVHPQPSPPKRRT